MLLIGNDGLDVNQAYAQMGIWALLPAPLLMSNDLRTIDESFKRVLLNKEIIAINQDKLGIPGLRVFHNESIDIWVRELSPDKTALNGNKTDNIIRSVYAFGVLNRKQTFQPLTVHLKLSELGIPEGSYRFRDVIKQEDYKYKQYKHGEYLKLSVPSTGLTLIKATPVS